AAADHDRNLDPELRGVGDLAGDERQDLRVDAVALVSHQRLAGDLEQDALVRWLRHSRPTLAPKRADGNRRPPIDVAHAKQGSNHRYLHDGEVVRAMRRFSWPRRYSGSLALRSTRPRSRSASARSCFASCSNSPRRWATTSVAPAWSSTRNQGRSSSMP